MFCLFLDSDITALAKDKAYAQFHLDEISIHQVIAKPMYVLLQFPVRLDGCEQHSCDSIQLDGERNS